jgi:hypothetical protein
LSGNSTAPSFACAGFVAVAQKVSGGAMMLAQWAVVEAVRESPIERNNLEEDKDA